MPDVGNLTAKLTLDTAGFEKGVQGVEGMASSLAGGIGKALGGVAATVAGAVAAAGAGVTAIVAESVKAYGEYEQLVGGAQKIFDQMDYNKIAEDANNAWQTMNLSASQYLSMINQVGATFAQTMGDAKGYETAKTGMQAIADYASGTGRNVEELNTKFAMITRAASSYQSIADQFSGILPATSKDFLAQAQAAGFLSTKYTELTKVPVAEYQEAVSQMLKKGVDDLNLTGNTAAETANTITGSIAGLQATWQNLLTTLVSGSSGELQQAIDNVVTSANALIENVAPAVEKALYGIAEVISALVPVIAERLPDLITQLVPMLLETAMAIVNALVENLPLLVNVLAVSLMNMLPTLVGAIINTLDVLLSSILPVLFEVAVKLVLAVMEGLLNNMDKLMATVTELIFGAIDTIIYHLPEFLELGVKIVLKIVEGILLAIPRFIQAIGELLGIVDNAHEETSQTFKSIEDGAKATTISVNNITTGMAKDVSSTEKAVEDQTKSFYNNMLKTSQLIKDNSGKVVAEIRTYNDGSTQIIKDGMKTILDETGKTVDKYEYQADWMKDTSSSTESAVEAAMDSVGNNAEKAASQVEAAVDRINSAIGSIAGASMNIPGLAGGGDMESGKPYIVGELGPELIVPKSSQHVFNAEETEELLSSPGIGGGIYITIEGDVYDDERSMRNKLQDAMLSVLHEQVAYA